MVALNTDFSTITPAIGGGTPAKPEGWYTGMVVETTAAGTKDSQQTGNTMLVCKIAFQDGSHHIERFNLWHQNDDTKRIAAENLSAMLAAMGLSGQQLRIADTSQFHNLPFELFLNVEETTTDKGNKIKQNRMKAVRDKSGKVYGNAAPNPAAQPAGGTAAPAAGFHSPPAPAAAAAPGPAAFGGAPAQPWGGQPQAAAAPAAPAAPAPFTPPGGGAPAPFTPPAGGGGFPQPGGGPAPWGGPQQ